jgi:hypothetical protein
MSSKGACAAVLLAVCLAGCKDKPPEPVPITGKVQDEAGNPMGEMLLTLHPVEEKNKNARIESALTNKEGTFSLTSVPGKYKITMLALPKGGSFGGAPTGGNVPAPDFGPGAEKRARYRDPQQTPWSVDVPLEGKKDLVLTFK